MMADEKFYLKELSEKLNKSIVRIKRCTTAESNEELLKELGNIVDIERDLRERCGVGARFKVVREQLQNILQKYTKKIRQLQLFGQDVEKKTDVLLPDEMLVYVYLFNAQGSTLKNWENLLLPKALIDHSVNRPIYVDQQDIEKMLRAKQNKTQHAYLIIAIKKQSVLQTEENKELKDQYGFPLLRIKQGSLDTAKIKKFIHNEHEYKVTDQGKLVL
jgi:hypothetical protein